MAERRGATDTKSKRFQIWPIAPKGLDLFARSDMLALDRAIVAQNVRWESLSVRRREGRRAIQQLSLSELAVGARAVGSALADMILIPFHPVMNFAVAPWAIAIQFEVVIPSPPPLNHGAPVFAREIGDGSHRLIYGIEVLANGIIVAKVTTDNGTQWVLGGAARTNGEIVRCLISYDPDVASGQLDLFVNGVSEATAVGVGVTQPYRSTNTGSAIRLGKTSADWGVTTEPNTEFTGAIDAFCAWSWPSRKLRQKNPNGLSLLDTLLMRHRQTWPNPASCAWHYGFDEPQGQFLIDIVAKDASPSQNHGEYKQVVTAVPGLAIPMEYGQGAFILEKQSGSIDLIAMSGGRTFIQPVRVV